MTATFKEMKGSIFDSEAEMLVNPVNCVGVAGKGLALEFRKKYPESYTDYREVCKAEKLEPGSLTITYEQHKRIVHFPTKIHWKDDSHIFYIAEGLKTLKSHLSVNHTSSVAIPAIGCGLGNLDWEEVRNLIISTLQDTDCTIELYPPK